MPCAAAFEAEELGDSSPLPKIHIKILSNKIFMWGSLQQTKEWNPKNLLTSPPPAYKFRCYGHEKI